MNHRITRLRLTTVLHGVCSARARQHRSSEYASFRRARGRTRQPLIDVRSGALRRYQLRSGSAGRIRCAGVLRGCFAAPREPGAIGANLNAARSSTISLSNSLARPGILQESIRLESNSIHGKALRLHGDAYIMDQAELTIPCSSQLQSLFRNFDLRHELRSPIWLDVARGRAIIPHLRD